VSEPPRIATARLLLRPFAPDDAPAVERLAGAFEVADGTLTIPHPYPEGAAAAWIATLAPAWAAGSLLTLAIAHAGAPHEPLGAVGLHIRPEHARAELGYWIGLPFWGRGYATEAARALMDHGFATLGLDRIEASHFTRNPASGRVMQKLGMRLEGVLRHAYRRWGRPEDVALYAVLAEEWREGAGGARC
jgi:RimJ/RimL family protein N-acetyltransferase